MLKEDIINDPLMQRLELRKQLRKNTVSSYVTAFMPYCELTKKTPSELRSEAYKEQVTIPDKMDRSINTYLFRYYKFLKEERGLEDSTIRTMMSRIRAFYNEFDIDLPKNIRMKKKKTRRESESLSIDHVREAILSTNSWKFKAVIALAASSGLRSGDIRHFTIQDFIDATEEYHDERDINNVISTLEKRRVIPCWELYSEKTSEHTITFSSPESVEYTLKYLKTRNDLSNDSILYTNKFGGLYSKSGFIQIFKSANSNLDYGYIEGNEYSFFHAHNLRSFFSTTLNKAGVPYAIYKKMMGQALGGSDPAYIHIDKKTCKNEYLRVVKDLSIHKVEVYDFKTKEYEEFLKEKEQMIKEREENNKRLDKMQHAMDVMKRQADAEKKFKEENKKD
ncbi:tyrosine-type recombinase/integrase [Methanobacterium paludis]|jgi:integrase|uniref:Integrase family protein n=1 Tax=Methanobacterium paludis (strain DSM 25820 / JCM 18151 / SWAN1) TaxID=868131 RepID=F6D3B0_METPW|nr:tyrosine-type recombinase/integrase [Methanobacterium paludis]AEG18702.1 integrase family protein [Methanobacterium paludis]